MKQLEAKDPKALAFVNIVARNKIVLIERIITIDEILSFVELIRFEMIFGVDNAVI